jgi:predicted AAA+ superfamily ATPase
MEALFSHPVFGSSWEGFVIEQILSAIDVPAYFYRTATGDEMDLVLDIHGKIIAIECKASVAPQVTKGFYKAIEVLKPVKTFIVAPIETTMYALQENIFVGSLKDVIYEIKQIL